MMNNLPFEETSLDGLDPSLTLHGSSDIDTALLSDIDDMLQLITTEDGDFPGLFDGPFCRNAPPEPNPHGPSLFSTYPGSSNPPSASLFPLPLQAPGSFPLAPNVGPNADQAPMDIKEEPAAPAPAPPLAQLPTVRSATPHLVPAPQDHFVGQPLTGFPRQKDSVLGTFIP
nr:sterol regulatory element-binding protein 1-like [Anolis sagrei ordinatus]